MSANRLASARPAVRPAMNARVLLAGPSGAGKTRTALIVAARLAETADQPILVVDTERGSALTYADDFTFTHLDWLPPYDPRELATTIRDAARSYSVTIVDSVSHFWTKEGGTLDISDGKFTGWKAARPAQESLVDAVMAAGNHVILCARSKQKHTQETDDRTGKQVVRKLGLGIQQDDTLDYEVNVALDLDMQHHLEVTKSRVVTVPVGRRFRPGTGAEEFAGIYSEWLAGGEPVAPLATVEAFKQALHALPDERRRRAKAEWISELGRPELLRVSQVAAAEALVARWSRNGAGEEPPYPSGVGAVPLTSKPNVSEPSVRPVDAGDPPQPDAGGSGTLGPGSPRPSTRRAKKEEGGSDG